MYLNNRVKERQREREKYAGSHQLNSFKQWKAFDGKIKIMIRTQRYSYEMARIRKDS